MLIHNKDDIGFVTEFPCFLGHPVAKVYNVRLQRYKDYIIRVCGKDSIPLYNYNMKKFQYGRWYYINLKSIYIYIYHHNIIIFHNYNVQLLIK